jgi:hypothetical protein
MRASVIAKRGAGVAVVTIVTITSGTAVAVSQASAPAHGHRTYFAEAFDGSQARIRPKVMMITANGVDVIRHVHWASWRNASAEGHGVVYADNCQPSCAQGHYRKDPAHIRLLKTTTICGKRFFVRMRLHYTGKSFPSGINRHQRYVVRPDSCGGTVAARPVPRL